MPSLLPGYEYDIFISYRQNDNHSGWVTEFVKALQEELATTIKDPVSVYFDINPNDGLLETHHVDKSLAVKLKCLIFVPIISQTYCDPKSFAWQSEFCAFNKDAKEDALGREIKLSSGNVASRILPVKIHDLDVEDKDLLEAEMGGVLRAIEFIYKEAGVNRPLKPEDQKEDNINKTAYRNQVNKVANAIKEIITAVKRPGQLKSDRVEGHRTVLSEPRSRMLGRSAVSIILLALLTFAYYYFVGGANPFTPTTERSIAVLPFLNMSNDPEQEYFSEGMTDEVLNRLYRIRELKVISRNSAMTFKGAKLTAKEIAAQLGVMNLLQGSVQKSGSRLKITVQLIDASDDTHLWSETYERELKDVFAIQAEIAQAVAKELRAKIGVVEDEKRNPEVHNLVMMGNFFRLQGDEENYYKALKYYNQALGIDSADATVWAGLAALYVQGGAWGPITAREGFTSAEAAAKKALQLDPELADAHRLLGSVKHSYYHDWAGASESYEKALQLQPGNSEILSSKAVLKRTLGHFEEAIELCKRALSLDPIDPRKHIALGGAFVYSGKLDSAAYCYKKGLELQPTRALAHAFLGFCYILQNKFPAAVIEFNKETVEGWRPFGLAMALWAQGDKAAATEALDEVISKHRNVLAYQIAGAYAFQGKADSAFRWLDRAFLLNDGGLTSLNIDPLLKSLHQDPRWKVILKKMNFPEN
jgi:adenylate cyclase